MFGSRVALVIALSFHVGVIYHTEKGYIRTLPNVELSIWTTRIDITEITHFNCCVRETCVTIVRYMYCLTIVLICSCIKFENCCLPILLDKFCVSGLTDHWIQEPRVGAVRCSCGWRMGSPWRSPIYLSVQAYQAERARILMWPQEQHQHKFLWVLHSALRVLNIVRGPWSHVTEIYAALVWWRDQMETFSASLAHCAGNSQVTAEFPAQRPVTRSFDVFFDLRLNKRLSK